jgi:hypothetical protein
MNTRTCNFCKQERVWVLVKKWTRPDGTGLRNIYHDEKGGRWNSRECPPCAALAAKVKYRKRVERGGFKVGKRPPKRCEICGILCRHERGWCNKCENEILGTEKKIFKTQGIRQCRNCSKELGSNRYFKCESCSNNQMVDLVPQGKYHTGAAIGPHLVPWKVNFIKQLDRAR